MPSPQIVRTRLIPPRKSPRTLERPRVTAALSEALQYRLTLLQAGAGYGKSTALLSLHETGYPLIWYQISEEDADPLVFLFNLCHATQLALPELEELPIARLQSWEGSWGPLPAREIVDLYLNVLAANLQQPVLLVFDDAHAVAHSVEVSLLLDRLVGLAPADLHILLAGRPALKLPNLSRYRSRGEALVLDQSLLAFKPDEIRQLFEEVFAYEITPGEVEQLHAATEGWSITLHLIWQSLRTNVVSTIAEALSHQAASLESLFEVLTQEVFTKQPEDVQQFLRETAVLGEMTAEACDALRGRRDSAALLAYLRREELFIVDLGDERLRYQHIFQNFLQMRSSENERKTWHRLAARYFQERDALDTAIYHFLQAQEVSQAAEILSFYGPGLLVKGRLDTLAAYLDALPPETLSQHPILLTLLADLARLHSRFQEALGWYKQAEEIFRANGSISGVARALRGQARVYLDTVDPSRAEDLLQQALRISDGIADRESQVRLYALLAENKLNAGKLEEAERLRQRAQALQHEGPSDSQLMMRVLLRTGRLEEARRQLVAIAETERQQPIRTPRAHRETLLILSIVYSFMGEAGEAYHTAVEGTRRGIELDSPFVTAVGHMRQGHALMLLPGADRYAEAQQQFERAIKISQELDTPRLRVEARWGLCRVFGYRGDLTRAMQEAQEAIYIANQTGDDWIASICRLTMGASLVLADRYEAASDWLEQAIRGFRDCNDPFGALVGRLWVCLSLFLQGDRPGLSQILPEVLVTCSLLGYDYLFTRQTLLGPPDERRLIPLLILAREAGWEAAYASRLLSQLNLPNISLHPGYQLRVQTLGGFHVWRGALPIPARGWQREKARHLFQLLLTYRSSPLDREQILALLWPGVDAESAGRNFKAALNTLYQVLEPKRRPGNESAYILREGNVYALRPEADLWLDAAEFESACQEGHALLSSQPEQALERFDRALQLYQGEYLPDARYETWAAAERERLAVLFLRAADALCELYFEAGRFDELIATCQTILQHDNCWERAYRYLMLGFSRRGDHAGVARTFLRCQTILKEELDVSPAPETLALYNRLIGK
jgi:ATP/maltotriose-dependent transcriptional regulator MalT/DNA-binding SARP family transcriptional activator